MKIDSHIETWVEERRLQTNPPPFSKQMLLEKHLVTTSHLVVLFVCHEHLCIAYYILFWLKHMFISPRLNIRRLWLVFCILIWEETLRLRSGTKTVLRRIYKAVIAVDSNLNYRRNLSSQSQMSFPPKIDPEAARPTEYQSDSAASWSADGGCICTSGRQKEYARGYWDSLRNFR